MQWNHLPVLGGIYDQDPKLIEQFEFIFGEVNKKQTADHKKQMDEAKRK